MKLAVLAEEGLRQRSGMLKFKTRNTAPKAMLCMNYCICIKKVLHSWFYPLQIDCFLTYYRNKSFHLLFYRSLCFCSVYGYIHNTFLCKKIHTILFCGQKGSHFTKETVPERKSRTVMVFYFIWN